MQRASPVGCLAPPVPDLAIRRQLGHTSVLSELTWTVSLVARESVELVGAGRTDAGVHAWGQVVSATCPPTSISANSCVAPTRCSLRRSRPSAEWADADFGGRPVLCDLARLPVPHLERPCAESAAGDGSW
jgi:hypothetical protein